MLSKIYDMIEEWDCDFLWTKEEIEKWRHEDFYLFLLGQHTIQGKINGRFKEDWKESGYYKRGKARAFKRRDSRPYVGII